MRWLILIALLLVSCKTSYEEWHLKQRKKQVKNSRYPPLDRYINEDYIPDWDEITKEMGSD